MCTHYATVFVQAATALGFVARHNVIQAHCVAEVWVNDWRKWVMFDPGCDTDDDRKGTYHFQRNGVPMTALKPVERGCRDGRRTWMASGWSAERKGPIASTALQALQS